MKTLKRKMIFFGMMVASLSLVACNGSNGGSKSGDNNKSSGQAQSSERAPDSIPEEPVEEGPVFDDEDNTNWPSYTVTFDYQGNGTNATQNVKYKGKLTKPADPTAPAGKKFYGWMNRADGGRIWNFNRKQLNTVMGEMTLVPCFIDADKDPQVFEAEYTPDILGPDETGMDGATYSGGQKGKGLIGRDWDYELSASHKVGAEDSDGEYLPGAFVHFLYVTGDTLTWELESSAAASNVTLFARFAAEYAGTPEDYGKGTKYSFTDQMFTVKVNNQAINYGTIAMRNVPPVGGFLPFSDYMLSATVNLVAGKNTIQMKVDNEVTIFSTAHATAPMVDCIKLVSSSTLTWPGECLTNMDNQSKKEFKT